MGATGRRVIDLVSNAINKEGIAAATLTPGYCVKYDSNAELALQDDEGSADAVRLVLPNSLEGQGMSDAYAIDDTVQFKTFAPGDEVLLRIKDGENIAKGDQLTHDGAGKFREVVADSSGTKIEDAVKAIALEACDMSSSSGGDADGFCLAEVV